MKLYNKRYYSNFPIVNFPFICSNIPAYGVYISQMIRYSRACGSYQDFLDRGPWSFVTQIFHNGQPSHGGDRNIFEVMTSTLPKGTLGSVASLLAATLYQGNPDRNHKLRICSTCRKHFPVLSSFTTYYRICNYINTTGATSGAGTAHPSGVPEFTPGF
jgi:hypothetical protein